MAGGDADGRTVARDRRRPGRDSTADQRRSVVDRHPWAAVVALTAVLFGVQVAEILAGVPERYGTPVAGPVATLLVAAALVAWTGWPSPRGLSVRRAILDRTHSRDVLGRAVLLGGGAVLAVNAAAVALQLGALAVRGRPARVLLRPENPITGVVGEAIPLYLVFGVVVTAVGQELFFRGAVLRAVESRMDFFDANVIQAGLYGLWHLAWPVTIAVSSLQPPVPMPVYAVGTVAVTWTVGAVFGVLARSTGTLLAPVLGHLVHNGLVVVVHIRAGSIDQARVLSATLVLGYVLLAVGLGYRHRDLLDL